MTSSLPQAAKRSPPGEKANVSVINKGSSAGPLLTRMARTIRPVPVSQNDMMSVASKDEAANVLPSDANAIELIEEPG